MTVSNPIVKQMIAEHRRRHNVMAGHYWTELADQMGEEIYRLTVENNRLRKDLSAVIRVASRIKIASP